MRPVAAGTRRAVAPLSRRRRCYLLEHLQERGHESIPFAPAGGPERCAGTQVVGLPGRRRPIYPTDVPGYCRRYGFGLLARPAWRYIRWLHNQAAPNLCPSSVTRADLEFHRVRNLKVWTRGVDTGRFSPEWRSQEMRAALGDGHPEAPLLLYVGRLAPEKRVDWLADLVADLPGARLAIVGGGPGVERLRSALAGTPTVFAGYLRGAELAQAYASSDVFAFPSANETFGNVVLEAAASGLPVIAPASGGVVDVVGHEENGLLFDYERVAGLGRSASG